MSEYKLIRKFLAPKRLELIANDILNKKLEFYSDTGMNATLIFCRGYGACSDCSIYKNTILNCGCVVCGVHEEEKTNILIQMLTKDHSEVLV